jgi:chromosome segregation ATPase
MPNIIGSLFSCESCSLFGSPPTDEEEDKHIAESNCIKEVRPQVQRMKQEIKEVKPQVNKLKQEIKDVKPQVHRLKEEVLEVSDDVKKIDTIVIQLTTDLSVLAIKMENIIDRQKEYHNDMRTIKSELRDDIKFLRDHLTK